MNNNTAIVTLGGAYRATYYVGVLKALDKLGINNFDMYLGASSGAPALAYFMANQCDLLEEICVNYVPTKETYNPFNLFTKKPIVNLDYLVDDIFKKRCPLDVDKIKYVENKLVIPVLNYNTGEVEYKSDQEEDFYTLLKATMSLPWLNKKFYSINGQTYVDSGITGRPPIKKILDEGYKNILLLMPKPEKSYLRWKERILEHIFFLLCSNIDDHIKNKLKFDNMINHNVLEYHIQNPGYVNIVVISPEKEIIGRFENSSKKVKASIDMGYGSVMNNEELIKRLEVFK